MPKIATDYSNTIMYKIVCKDLNIKDCYVGHTTNWIKRKSRHKSNCNNQNNKTYNFNVYQFIRENGGWDNWEMIEICKYSCNDKREAEAEERRLYEQLNGNLNMVRPFITNEEKNKEQKERNKNYYNKNKNEILENQKNYQEQNKDKIKIRKQNYYEKNKNKIKEKNKIKIICDCGGKYTLGQKIRHLKSKKHINYINNLN